MYLAAINLSQQYSTNKSTRWSSGAVPVHETWGHVQHVIIYIVGQRQQCHKLKIHAEHNKMYKKP